MLPQVFEGFEGRIAQRYRFFRGTGRALSRARHPGLNADANFVKVPALRRKCLRDARGHLTQFGRMRRPRNRQLQTLIFQLGDDADRAQCRRQHCCYRLLDLQMRPRRCKDAGAAHIVTQPAQSGTFAGLAGRGTRAG